MGWPRCAAAAAAAAAPAEGCGAAEPPLALRPSVRLLLGVLAFRYCGDAHCGDGDEGSLGRRAWMRRHLFTRHPAVEQRFIMAADEAEGIEDADEGDISFVRISPTNRSLIGAVQISVARP